MSVLALCTHQESESQATIQVQRDPLWNAIQAEALEAAEHDPVLRPMFDRFVLNHRTLGCALVHRLAELLTETAENPELFRRVFAEVLVTSPAIQQAINDDLLTIRMRDPAATSNLTPFLHFKGFTHFRPVALRTRCGTANVNHWPFISRDASRQSSVSTFIQPRRSDAEFSLITQPELSSERQQRSATTPSFCTTSHWEPRARTTAIVTPRSTTTCSSEPARRSSATFRSAEAQRSVPAASFCETCLPEQQLREYLPASCIHRRNPQCHNRGRNQSPERPKPALRTTATLT